MDDEPSLNGAEAEVERLLEDRFFEGLLRSLQKVFPSLSEEGPEAIAHAVEKTITRNPAPNNVRKYLTAVSYNHMKRLATRRARASSLDALQDEDDAAEPVEEGWSVEERALLKETYLQLKAQVETWETASVRTVTLLYLEAAFLGEPLLSAEAAELVSDLLAEPVDDDVVRTWKSRGFKRLQAFIQKNDVDDEEGDS